MKIAGFICFSCLLIIGITCTANAQDPKFSSAELSEDLDFLQKQVFNVHCDPYTELKKPAFESLFFKIRTSLKDSMTAADFFSLIKPVVAFVADEHADIGMPGYFKSHKVFLPFSVSKRNGYYIVETELGASPVKAGDTIISVGHKSMQLLTAGLSSFTTGTQAERDEKAMTQFGYLYGMANPADSSYVIRLTRNRVLTIQGIDLSSWSDYLRKIYGGSNSGPMLGYRKEGRTGYIKSASFSVHGDNELTVVGKQIDSIFQLIQKDHVSDLVIDVSQNSGGNSAVGDLLINHIYSKPYRTYQMNWRRSDEYLKVLKSYGDADTRYESAMPGELLHYDADIQTPLITAQKFTGKVFVVVGSGTFSSAIMFATIVKDNAIAKLVGVVPKLGHPSHFGELYGFKLPHTQLPVRFGVKEWIRPAGKKVENVLRPDIVLPDTAPPTVLTAIEAGN